jgi:hypothetical protein
VSFYIQLDPFLVIEIDIVVDHLCYLKERIEFWQADGFVLLQRIAGSSPISIPRENTEHLLSLLKIAPPALFSHWWGSLVLCLVLGPVKSSRGLWF